MSQRTENSPVFLDTVNFISEREKRITIEIEDKVDTLFSAPLSA